MKTNSYFYCNPDAKTSYQPWREAEEGGVPEEVQGGAPYKRGLEGAGICPNFGIYITVFVTILLTVKYLMFWHTVSGFSKCHI